MKGSDARELSKTIFQTQRIRALDRSRFKLKLNKIVT